MFILNAGPHWEKYSSTRELVETVGLITVLQMFVALVATKLLVPKFLDRQKWLLLILALFSTIIFAAEINILVSVLYLEKRYASSYLRFLELFGHMSLAERMSLTWSMRYIFFSKFPLFLFPAALLVAFDFYSKQQALLRLQEQKKSAELDALKSQLNPHFIFNTLNNIYSLALKKSDQTPQAIEQLSAILDYVVYRCDKKYVSLDGEVKVLENYIALEKLRYGKRLSVTLENRVMNDLSIAPLILLTLLENACKHGTREELGQAKVTISIKKEDDDLVVFVSNSKPTDTVDRSLEKNKVGLANLRRQLALLYPNRHLFTIEDKKESYSTTLILATKD